VLLVEIPRQFLLQQFRQRTRPRCFERIQVIGQKRLGRRRITFVHRAARRVHKPLDPVDAGSFEQVIGPAYVDRETEAISTIGGVGAIIVLTTPSCPSMAAATEA